jgi:CelD/BcsL family acetyltransferase involved in cellulose biosynthesis
MGRRDPEPVDLDEIKELSAPFDIAMFEKMASHVGDLANPLFRLGALAFAASGYAVTLSATWSEFAAMRLPRRGDSRRRRLVEIDTLTFEIAETAAQYDEILDAMFRKKTRRYLETIGITEFTRPGYRAFFTEMARPCRVDSLVQLSALRINGTIISAHWDCVWESRFYYMMPSFESAAGSHCSAGHLLLEHLLEWSYASSMEAFNCGLGEERYKSEYCDTEISLHAAMIPVTARGHGYLVAQNAHTTMRRAMATPVIKLMLAGACRISSRPALAVMPD